ncbi:DUF6049 family protein [Actinomadura macra]|uniref:DUF6049 family protein n=1 Tax=Actinomadura macra TaxID=46164 RepID=UPI0008347B8C|nr:DUF6049 family protein [Actinomadura macra]
MRTVQRAAALAALLPCIIAATAPAGTAPVLAASRTISALPNGTARLGTATQPNTPAQPDAPEQPDLGSSAQQASARAQVGLALTRVTPKTVRENSLIDIAGLAQNRSGHQLPGLTIRLRYRSQPITSRSELDRVAAGQPSALPGVGRPVPLAGATTAGGKQNWGFKTTAKALGLRALGSAPGVYPVGVEVLNSAQQVVGGVTTFLTFVPTRGNFKKVAVGWVWPLIDRQHRADDQTFLDDQLSKDMASGGRLSELVGAAAATNTPITWGIDPALLDDVQQMAGQNYAVKSPGTRKTTEKRKSAAAAAWLTALKEAAKSDPYFTVPYADPDVLALVRYKMSRDVVTAYDPKNTGIAAQTLGRPANAHIAWPAAGAAGPGTLDLLAKLALKPSGSFLMSSNQFQLPVQGAAANAVTALPTSTQGTKKALLYDDKLNEIVSKGSRSAGGGVLTEQRFLAETAMIAAETPNLQRTVIIAPDRHWNPAPGLAKNLLSFTKSAWTSPTQLSRFESAQPQGRVFNGYSDDYLRYELGSPYLAQVRNIARRAASFEAVMTKPIKISYQRALLRTESTAWRSRGVLAKRARDELSFELEREMNKVRIVTPNSKRVNMAGSSGKLPVTIENKLRNQSVTVRLTATSDNSTKLQLGRLDPEDEIISLRAGELVQRWIPAKAAGNGKFGVHLQLEIPNSGGKRFGNGQDITVRTTGYGRLALLITSGGLAVLFVGVGVRAIRARRRRKAEAAGDGSTGMGPATPGGPGNGFPGPGIPGPGGPGTEPWAGSLPGISSATTRHAPHAASGTGSAADTESASEPRRAEPESLLAAPVGYAEPGHTESETGPQPGPASTDPGLPTPWNAEYAAEPSTAPEPVLPGANDTTGSAELGSESPAPESAAIDPDPWTRLDTVAKPWRTASGPSRAGAEPPTAGAELGGPFGPGPAADPGPAPPSASGQRPDPWAGLGDPLAPEFITAPEPTAGPEAPWHEQEPTGTGLDDNAGTAGAGAALGSYPELPGSASYSGTAEPTDASEPTAESTGTAGFALPDAWAAPEPEPTGPQPTTPGVPAPGTASELSEPESAGPGTSGTGPSQPGISGPNATVPGAGIDESPTTGTPSTRESSTGTPSTGESGTGESGRVVPEPAADGRPTGRRGKHRGENRD